jgi:excinuclease ABC subunit A
VSDRIVIRGARQHNLKNVDVALPKNSLVVFTGPSGSGKSSLAFDTLYAEGQRRYVESLSAYARQFLGVQDKPDVDDIEGLSPAISIEQKGVSHNPRSTVGTVTEIYDYLRLIFGRIGTPHCPSCGKAVRRHSLDEIVETVLSAFPDRPVEILGPVVRGKKGEYRNLFAQLKRQGFLRARIDGEIYWLEEEIPLDKKKKHDIAILVDRMKVEPDRRGRIAEAVETALKASEGFVRIRCEGERDLEMTERYVCPDCQVSLPEIEPRLFSFNNPYGACPDCSGLGVHARFSEERAVAPELSVSEGALLPWKTHHYMLERIRYLAERHGASLELPFRELPEEFRRIILCGTEERIPLIFRAPDGEESEYRGRYEGLLPWLERRYTDTESETAREEYLRYRVEDLCPTCRGKRLKPEALAVTVGGFSVDQVVETPIDALTPLLRGISLSEGERGIVGQVLEEILKRLAFLSDVGAGYLSLGRRADTLSGGESQRIRLATQIGSKLTGVLYVLDEPTIGLHPRDTGRLLRTLREIRDLGNSVVVVEHDRETMAAADWIVELGPGAGENGGRVVAEGPPDRLGQGASLTGPYLRGETDGVVLPLSGRREPSGFLIAEGCTEHNLKGEDVRIPLGVLAALSGVSGSGKSTLLYEILYKGLRGRLDREFRDPPGKHRGIREYEKIRNVVLVDQSPIGRTPRSNPATYTGVFTLIRELFARMPEAKIRGYGPGRFSFNVKGGRCEACGGDGVLRVSMLFLPDAYVRCDVCGGSRYNRETLEVHFKGKSVAEVLEMTVSEASELFGDIPRIASRLSVIEEAGLGYIRLGQPATTLSGGEAQRVKLATELGKRFRGPVLYLLDEPTTGLHYTDVRKLLILLHKLVDQGNSVLVIEHNLDVLASADRIVDLGPEGGEGGGRIVAEGTPEGLARAGIGHTARFLAETLDRRGRGGLA